MPYNDPNTKIENFLKEWMGIVWGMIKFFFKFCWTIFKEGAWVFKSAIPKERGRRRY